MAGDRAVYQALLRQRWSRPLTRQLRSRRLARWWLRLGAALLYASVLVAITFLTFVTDMPGLFYVPGQFALATFIVLAIVAVGSTIVHTWRKWLTG